MSNKHKVKVHTFKVEIEYVCKEIAGDLYPEIGGVTVDGKPVDPDQGVDGVQYTLAMFKLNEDGRGTRERFVLRHDADC